MLRIRLRRVGLKKQPSYRMVVAENEWPRDGRFLEIVGRYNPRTHPETVEVNEERMYHWLKNGAQPTESVAQLFRSTGTTDRFARFKAGEALETLVAEAQAAEALRNTSRRTSDAKSLKERPSKRQQKKAQAEKKDEQSAA